MKQRTMIFLITLGISLPFLLLLLPDDMTSIGEEANGIPPEGCVGRLPLQHSHAL